MNMEADIRVLHLQASDANDCQHTAQARERQGTVSLTEPTLRKKPSANALFLDFGPQNSNRIKFLYKPPMRFKADPNVTDVNQPTENALKPTTSEISTNARQLWCKILTAALREDAKDNV